MADYTHKVIKNTGIVLIGMFLSTIFGYILRLILARGLSTADFGLFYSIVALFSFLSFFQFLGLSKATVKYISEYKTQNRPDLVKATFLITLFLQLTVSFIIGLFCIIFSDWIATYYFHDISISIFIKIYAITVILFPLEKIFKIAFNGFQKMTYFSLVELFKTIFLVIVTLIFLNLNMGVFSPIIAYILVYLIPPIFLYFPLFSKKVFPNFWKTKAKMSLPLVKKLLSFGIYVLLSSIAGLIFFNIDTMVITYFRTLEEVGIYNVGYPTAKVLWVLTSALAPVILPIASELWQKKDKIILKQGINQLYKFSLCLIIPGVIVMFLFPETIISILFGERYMAAAAVLRIMSIGALLFSIATINLNILTGIGLPKLVGKIMLIAALFNAISTIIAVPFFGVNGAATTTVISFAILFIISSAKIRKKFEIKTQYKTYSKILISGIISMFIMYIIAKTLQLHTFVELPIAILIGGTTYLLFLFWLKIINKKEIKKITNRFLNKKSEPPIIEEIN